MCSKSLGCIYHTSQQKEQARIQHLGEREGKLLIESTPALHNANSGSTTNSGGSAKESSKLSGTKRFASDFESSALYVVRDGWIACATNNKSRLTRTVYVCCVGSVAIIKGEICMLILTATTRTVAVVQSMQTL
jgi:hypothetical protein